MSRIDEALRRSNQVSREQSVQTLEAACGGSFVDPVAPQVPFGPAGFDEELFGGELETLDEVDTPRSAAGGDVDEMRPTPPSVTPAQRRGDSKLVVSGQAPPIAVEQYRKLAATLHQVHVDRETKVVMVASAMPGEGKSLTAANLALTLSESFRHRVLLIDADLRRPTVHQLFQISNESGLNDALAATEDTKLALIEVSPRLTVLPAGRPNPDPMSGLVSDRMRRILGEAAARFEWVIIDTPPVGLLPDANLLSRMVDMVVFVIGAGTTPFRFVERAVNALDRERIVGVVLNRAAEAHAAYQYYGYYGTGVRES